MSYINAGRLLFAALFSCGLFAMALPVKAQKRVTPPTRENEGQTDARRQGRLAPPPGLDCDADHVTSFTGRVLTYSRRDGRIFIRVRTDEATTEQFTISYAQAQELAKRVKLNGETLTQSELEKIEARWKQNKRNVRVTVWACYDKDWRNPSAILIDWHIGKPKPPETL